MSLFRRMARAENRDAMIAMGLTFLVSAAVMASAAGTMLPAGIPVDRAIDMVKALAASGHRVTVLAGRPSYEPTKRYPWRLASREQKDGVTVERASNTVNDLVDGVTMTLSAVTSKAVSLTGSTPTSALSTVVSNFVSTFNDNMTALNKAMRGIGRHKRTVLKETKALRLEEKKVDAVKKVRIQYLQQRRQINLLID
ncbi:MAG: flagellar filament capping protein FliD, partial [Planctomycetes bacterium]|nr:flagellar filament capping protein FliD [Planctomycetota bacterium]